MLTQIPSLPSDDLKPLRSQLAGQLHLPGDARYDELRKPWLEVVDQHPALIVEAKSAADVAAAILFARDHELTLGVMATGHGIAAACDGGLLLNLSEMKQIDVNAKARTARVGPGVESGELLKQTEKEGLMYASGQVSSVGVIGYTLGGGTSWLVRKLGIACDAVTGAEMVLADGSIVHVSADENPDLLWAIRGGGGNFGVVTTLEITLEPFVNIVGGEVWYPLDNAPQLLSFYRDWAQSLPDDASSIFRFVHVPDAPNSPAPLRGNPWCMIGVAHADPDSADETVQRLLEFGKPTLNSIKPCAYSAMAALDPASQLPGSPTYYQTEILRELSDNVIETLARIFQSDSPHVMQIEIQQLGGALMQGDPDRFAFTPIRGAYALHLETACVGGVTRAEAAQGIGQTLHELGDVFTGEASYNFLRGDEVDRVPAVFGPQKYQRLRGIKARVDPNNVFSLNHNIPPAKHGTAPVPVSTGEKKRLKILVVGAGGKTGRAVVQQAVAAGHEVTAFVHSAADYDVKNVRVIEGDATKSDDMDKAVAGQDAVVDTIGGKTPYKTTTLEASAAKTIIASMQRQSVKRLIVTSMLGEGDSTENAPFYERLLVKTFLRGADKDKANMEAAVETSDLDWVIVRPAILTDDEATGVIRIFEADSDEKAHKISRADVAAWMLDQLSSAQYLHQCVTIANS